MRVKISYGVEIEEIPEELEELFRYVSDKSRSSMKQMQQVETFLADDEIESAMYLVEKLRRTLALVDNRLADIHMIGSGYVNYKTKEGVEDVREGRPSVDTTEERPPDRDAEQPRGNPHNAGT
jgi:hypothetical protein